MSPVCGTFFLGNCKKETFHQQWKCCHSIELFRSHSNVKGMRVFEKGRSNYMKGKSGPIDCDDRFILLFLLYIDFLWEIVYNAE